MAAKFTAKIDEKSIKAIQRKLKDLQSPITQKDAKKMGTAVIREMKRLISRGVSPIRGKGKFPPYKKPERYPGKRKSKTPVNLKLSGKFLKDLKAKPKPQKKSRGYTAEIGYRDPDQQIKEEGHRKGGSPGKRQPKRPTIPTQSGEQFAQRIQDVYLRFILKLQRKIAKRRN